MSNVSIVSFKPIGTPCNGPRRGPRSSARAWANASSGSKFTNALTTPSRAAIRVMQSRVTASQVVSPAAIVLAISIADNSLSGRSSLASMFSPRLLSLRRLRGAAMRLRPAGGIFHELLDFFEPVLVELAALLGHFQNIPPGGERMQGDAQIPEDLFALGKDVVEEEHEDMLDHGAGLAQRLTEIDLAAAVGSHVLDQQHTVARLEVAFDLGITAEALRLLAHILHRQHELVGHPGRERNARGFPAGDRIELLETGIAHDCRRAEIDQRLPHARKRDQAPTIGIDRARPARRIDERLIGHEADGVD